MPGIVRRMPWGRTEEERESLLQREWLVTNGLGGYASGTVSGVATRRYHGLLIAALPAPLGRTLTLAHLSEKLRLADGREAFVGGYEQAGGALNMFGAEFLTEFRLEHGLPIWTYEIGDVAFEKKIVVPHGQNAVFIIYRLLDGVNRPIRLKILPSLHFRSHDADVNTPLPEPITLKACKKRYEIHAGEPFPPLRMKMHGSRPVFTIEEREVPEWLFRQEYRRGYTSRGTLWSPGYFRVDLEPGNDAALVATTESWETVNALGPNEAWTAEVLRHQRLLAAAPPEAREGFAGDLVLAADQFIIEPAGRREDAARAQASGDQARTIIAGYHWFTDWGRDTMISLEGLTLCTGRELEAGYILRTFAQHIRDGLIPNLFPEGEKEGLYHTADATLWFFHALDRYVKASEDVQTLEELLPKFIDIVEHHLRGTRFGIAIDPEDGLMTQGAEGYQLTWMDAKVGDWVVTPRRGKAVELNALWYNALRLLERWLLDHGDDQNARRMAEHAERAYESFNKKFWYEEGAYLYDVIEGEVGRGDTSCRPNQVFAISLDYPVLARDKWEPVMETVRERLLTPVGLRSLAPGHPDYRPRYDGDLRSRDAAYHQGTVWGWLIGPYVDAWLKLHPDATDAAVELLDGFQRHLDEACIGSISEVFDAEAPYTSRGCIAQAWSVAEVLRSIVKVRRSAAHRSSDYSAPTRAEA